MGTISSTPILDVSTIINAKTGKAGAQRFSKVADFGENTKNQVSYVQDNISYVREETYSIKLKVEEVKSRREEVKSRRKELESMAVIGLALNRVSADHIESSSFCLWNLSKGNIILAEGSCISVEKVKVCGEILIHFIPGSAKVSLTISNPKEKAITREINILSKIPVRLVPYVGVISDGQLSNRIIFTILDIVVKNENNITEHVSFTKCYGTIEVSSDGLIIGRKQHQQGNGCALLPIKITGGRHRWTLMIHSDYGASVCVGLARYPFKLLDEYMLDQLKHIYKHPGLVLYRTYRGYLYKDGREMSYSLEALNWSQEHQQSVRLEFVFEDGKLEIIKNGRNMGTAFEGLFGSYQPIVCFYAAYSKKVELKSYFTTESLFDVLIMTTPLSSLEIDGATASRKERSHIIQYEKFCFDESAMYGKAALSEDKKTIFRLNTQSGNAFCFVNIRCSQIGIYRFSFVVEIDQGASTCIGVTNVTNKNQIKIPGHLYHSKELFLYRSFQGMVYLGGSEQSQRFDEFWMSGTLVEMEVTIRRDESFVQFKINGSDQGVVLPGLQQPLTPVITFYSGMEKRVTFLHFEFQSIPEPPLSLLSRDSSSSLINDTATSMTHGHRPQLPPIVRLTDAVMYSTKCKRCDNAVDVIPLPCRHAFLCSHHISIGLNAATRRCIHCDNKITQLWNVFHQPKP